MLFRDVRELEIEAERAQDLGLLVGSKQAHGVANSVDVAAPACVARKQPDPLLGFEQIVAFLLGDDLAEHSAEDPNVPAKRGVGLRTHACAHDDEDASSCRRWSSRSTATGSSPRAASRT